jgi:hypothetical protein
MKPIYQFPAALLDSEPHFCRKPANRLSNLPSEYGSDSWMLPLICFRTFINRRTGAAPVEKQTFSREPSLVRPRETKTISNNANERRLDLYSGFFFALAGSRSYFVVFQQSGGRVLTFSSDRRVQPTGKGYTRISALCSLDWQVLPLHYLCCAGASDQETRRCSLCR